MTAEAGIDAFHLSNHRPPHDQRFCIHHHAAAHVGREPRGVVCVPPFAEEMNKTRRMLALQAQQLAEAGCEVIRPDLAGCGDSAGDLIDASWKGWIEDVLLAARWLHLRGVERVCLWGVRAGALLAADAARAWPFEHAPSLLFWQPQLDGKAALRQFLRLASVRASLDGRSLGIDELQRSMAERGSIDIAGYTLSQSLADGFSTSRLEPPPNTSTSLWFELGATDDALTPALDTRAAAWRAAGWDVRAQRVIGPLFWQTTEIEEAPNLLRATTTAMQSWLRSD